MNPNLVIVFVDAFPYEHICHLSRSREFLTWTRPLRPGFGYSVNVKSELFAGLVPDAAGFLNEWTYHPGQGFLRFRVPAAAWRWLARRRLLKRAVSKTLSRVMREDLRNIPLPLLSSLARRGENAYEHGYPRETIFRRYGLTRYLYTEHGGDEAAFRALYRSIESSSAPVRAFLAQCDLDHVMHKHGKGSDAYWRAIDAVDERLAALWQLLAKRGGGRIILVSDHGMAPVERTIPFDIEKRVAGAGDRYGYFVDATMARVWTRDDAVRHRIESWIAASDLPGRVLNEAERARWGITNPEFGDIVFLLDEGVMFAPNFFGDKGCRAMHGYWPELTSQLGVLAATTPLSSDGADPVSALRAHEVLSQCAAI